MNELGVTFGGYLAKILSFKSGNLLYKSNFYLLSEGIVHLSYRNSTSFELQGMIKGIAFWHFCRKKSKKLEVIRRK